MKKGIKRVTLLAAAVFMLLWSVIVIGGLYFTVRPRPDVIEDIEAISGYPVEPVSIATEDGVELSAWHVAGQPDKAVILLAGIDADRRACMGRAALYLEQGYSVLLPDLRATGRSGGDAVTLGWRERKDVVACYAFLRERGYSEIGANGISLGAATICYALPELPDIAFIVLESGYDSVVNAVRNRLAMFHAPHFIAWPYYVGLSFYLGAPAWQLRPSDYMQYCSAPALIMAGDAEPELHVSETETLYEQCASSHKHLHLFEEGRHQDFLGRYPEKYTELVRTFLKRTEELQEPSAVGSGV